METIYLSMRAQVDVGTFFMKSPIPRAGILYIIENNGFSCYCLMLVFYTE